MKHSLRRRYGRSSFKPIPGSGVKVGVKGTAHVTKEPDGLYYSWDRGNWYLGFKSKKKALDHMRVLARVSV